MGVGFAVGVLGVVLLSHAAYSTIQYTALLKIMEEEFSGPPMNVIVELLSGLILCMWAALTVPGKFLSILPDSDENRPAITMGVGFAVGVLGVVLLSHAAYSTIQYTALLKIMEEEFSGPPMNVIVELLSGLILCMWAALTVPGKFLSILPDSDENRVVSLPSNLDFMIFNHRGRAFPSETDLKLK